jgi:hypothetical protein
MERRPRQAEGQAWHSRPPKGPESPAQTPARVDREGARCPHPASAPAAEALGLPGPRAPASGRNQMGALRDSAITF